MTDRVGEAPTLDSLRLRREDILALARRYKADNVRVFGSVARGEATLDSDIDLLVTFQDGANLYDLSGLWLDLQELLGRSVDLVSDEVHPRHERFKRRILKEAVPL